MPDASTRPGPKLPRMEKPTLQPQPQLQYKPSLLDKLIEGAALGTGAYLAVRMIRYITDDSSGRDTSTP